MPKKQMIEFVEAKRPITEPVTKFGGQPVWIDTPQWPISKELGKPMQFICQIKIDPDLFGDCPAKMAYLFITDDRCAKSECETWDPDAGENAVILQPGNTPIKINAKALTEGPVLYQLVAGGLLKKKRFEQPCEFSVNLREGDDPDFMSEPDIIKMAKDKRDSYYEVITGSKIGGTPHFIQGGELPFPDGWYLLAQIDSENIPFGMCLGDSGIGHVFMNSNGTEAKYLWQGC